VLDGGAITIARFTRLGGASRRPAAQCVDLAAQTGDLAAQAIALAEQIGELGAHGIRFGPRGRAGLPPDFRGLVLRGLQDVLHAVGERADHVRLVGPRTWRGPLAGTGRRGQTGAEPGRRWHNRQWLAARGLEIGAHPRYDPLQPPDMLVDLPPVVTAQHDVKAWGARPPHICRHREALPLFPFTSPRVGRSGPSNRLVHSYGAYRIEVNRLLPVFRSRPGGCSDGRGLARLTSVMWTSRCNTRCMSAVCG
jgi:hypothetical protein